MSFSADAGWDGRSTDETRSVVLSIVICDVVRCALPVCATGANDDAAARAALCCSTVCETRIALCLRVD